MHHIYPSFSSDDYDWLHTFEGLLANPNNTVNAFPIVERRNLQGSDEETIKSYLRPRITQVDVLVLLLGQNTHSRRWVKYELEVAISKDIPYFGINLPIDYPGDPPHFIKDSIEIVNWNVREIQSAIDRYAV